MQLGVGLFDSLFASTFSTILVLVGLGALLFGVFAIVQTQRWPSQAKPEAKKPASVAAPKDDGKDEAPQRAMLRPATTTKDLRITFPDIDTVHPDVWSSDEPLVIQVEAPKGDPTTARSIRLSRHRAGETQDLGTVGLDDDGQARFEHRILVHGEHDVVAELLVDDRATGQAVRSIRIVSYRDEIVETFEDFVAWAAAHYPFVDRKMTAREFVDKYADGRPGTPAAPLDQIADLYELANYSEHPVTRATYLQLVDAFLALEEAGALESPQTA